VSITTPFFPHENLGPCPALSADWEIHKPQQMAFPLTDYIPNCITFKFWYPLSTNGNTGFLILLMLENVTNYNMENHLFGESIIMIGSYTLNIKTPSHLMSWVLCVIF